MDRWSRVGWVVLVVGLVVLASSATGLQREMVGMAALWTNVESQITAPMEFPPGALTIWIEDHPSWPEDPWKIVVSLRRGEDDSFWGDVPDKRKYRDIAGVQCFLVTKLNDVFPEGEWSIRIQLMDWDSGGKKDRVNLYVQSSLGAPVIVGLVCGTIVAVVGAFILVKRKWEENKK